MSVQDLNFILALGTLILQIGVIALLILYFSKKSHTATTFLETHGIRIAFVLVSVTAAMALFYSNVLDFEPCSLCWWQRIFLFPQVILLGVALIKKERLIACYSIALSVPGALIALYQHYLQMGGSALVKCEAFSGGVDCAKRILFEFGYITFPLMSFTVFVTLILIMLFVRRSTSPSMTTIVEEEVRIIS